MDEKYINLKKRDPPEVSEDSEILKQVTYKLYIAINKSFLDDFEKLINLCEKFPWRFPNRYEDINDYYKKMKLKTEFFINHDKELKIKIKEIINMASRNIRDRKKEVNKIELNYSGSNDNDFKVKLYPDTEKKAGEYKRIFMILEINGISISCSFMNYTGSNDERESFINWPSYYNEDKDEYSAQVQIKDDNLKSDLKELIKKIENKL